MDALVVELDATNLFSSLVNQSSLDVDLASVVENETVIEWYAFTLADPLFPKIFGDYFIGLTGFILSSHLGFELFFHKHLFVPLIFRLVQIQLV